MEKSDLRLECIRIATSAVFETRAYGTKEMDSGLQPAMTDEAALARAKAFYDWITKE